jgi:hypothetical protein
MVYVQAQRKLADNKCSNAKNKFVIFSNSFNIDMSHATDSIYSGSSAYVYYMSALRSGA